MTEYLKAALLRHEHRTDTAFRSIFFNRFGISKSPLAVAAVDTTSKLAFTCENNGMPENEIEKRV